MPTDRESVKGTPRLPTMEDVAARAGVSRALVSLVMRKEPNVSDARRARVLAAAAALGYRPNAAARSLASRRTKTVGVLLNDLHNPFFAEIADGIEHVASAEGYRVLLGTGGRLRPREEASLEAFLESRVDGLILLSTMLDMAKIGEAARIAPVVVVSRSVGSLDAGRGADLAVEAEVEVDSITTDDDHGTLLAVSHLTGLGHSQIAHIDGGTDHSAGPRRRGYERAMAASGLEPLVVPGDFSEEGGAEAVSRLLETGPPPTAVLAANDLAAAGAMARLEEVGFAVPADVSVVGYDNTFLARVRRLNLTTVNQPREEMGRLAMQTLLGRMLDGRAHAVHLVTSPTLVVRGSTAPVRSGAVRAAAPPPAGAAPPPGERSPTVA